MFGFIKQELRDFEFKPKTKKKYAKLASIVAKIMFRISRT